MTEQRDIRVDGRVDSGPPRRGRNLIAVIGIDRYQHWRPLSNAVNDARGALALFERLGFAHTTEPLIDAAATQRAIQSLVTDDLAMLHPEDSLVLFYAGHGGNRRHSVGDREVTTGYLIPADADQTRVSTWVDLEAWLRAAALLPARHILVILDACHSGIALDPVIKWRDDASSRKEPLSTLNARRSRRIITSALNNQRAMDGGPIPGHSLFTGCLIEALTHDLHRSDEAVTTGSELGLHLQRRVASYPHSQQTPDFGTFAFDARGEMLISLVLPPEVEQRHEATPASTVPTWLHLIDLDDRPGLEVDNGIHPAATPDPEVGAEGALAVTAEPPEIEPPRDTTRLALHGETWTRTWPHAEATVLTPVETHPAAEMEDTARREATAPVRAHAETLTVPDVEPQVEDVGTRRQATPMGAADSPEARRWGPEDQTTREPLAADAEFAAYRESVTARRTTRAAMPTRDRAATVGAVSGDAQGSAAVDVATEAGNVPDTVEIASRPVLPWITRVTILAILGAVMFFAWKHALERPMIDVDTSTAPVPVPVKPAPPSQQPPPPPTAKIVLETADPEDVTARRASVIEFIPDKDTPVKKTEVIAKLEGYKPLEAAVNAMKNDLTQQRALLDAALERFDAAHAADNKAKEAAAQAEITERRKLIANRDTALTAKIADLDTYQVRAPRNGTFAPSVPLNAAVASDTVIGKLMRESIPVATFKISNTYSFAPIGSVEISIHKGERRVTCTVVDVRTDSVKVACPPDPELTEGLEVAL